MALIAMAVYDTEENKRTNYTRRTVRSLYNTVDFEKHRLCIIDNGSCQETQDFYEQIFDYFHNRHLSHRFTLIKNSKNLGTAEAINLGFKDRWYGNPSGNAIKMDNDVVIHTLDWIEQMEEAISRESKIGQVGLKRKDCIESPDRTDFYKSELIMLPHKPGEKWIVAEKVEHVMGTCQMYSSALLDKIGYLYQPRLYGFDDSLASYRSKLAGFINVFLPHINIDHIDTGETPYQKWKENHASEQWQEYHNIIRDYREGRKSIYYNPFQS